MIVNMIGLGYIGLPTAAIMANTGKMRVLGVDISEKICSTINRGEIHIVEPGLQEIVEKVVSSEQLVARTSPSVGANVYVIAVPTPFKDERVPDLSYIKEATRSIAPCLIPGALVILESTSPVGATDSMMEWLQELRPDLSFPTLENIENGNVDINIAYCPERVLPGNVIEELKTNARLIGGLSYACSAKARDFYQLFVEGECIITNARTAEMAKLTENSFRDVNIAFANELSFICDKLSINVWELIQMANLHPRVNILQPGCGVGGHCIAVDPWFIVDSAPTQARLIREAREINNSKPKWVADKVNSLIMKHLARNPSKAMLDVTVACYGVSFKPNIDDFRESPAIDVVNEIQKNLPLLDLMIVEPNLHGNDIPRSIANKDKVKFLSIEEARHADVKVFLVAHHEFKEEFIRINEKEFVLNVAWPN